MELKASELAGIAAEIGPFLPISETCEKIRGRVGYGPLPKGAAFADKN